MVKPTADDIEFVIENMRQADVDEVKASHGVHPGQLLRREVGSDTTLVGKVNGRPVCIFGVKANSIITGGGSPWLLATDEVTDNKVAFLRRNKRWVRDARKKYGTLSNYVDARNEDAKHWLKWLGFKLEEAKPYGVAGLPFHRFSMGEE